MSFVIIANTLIFMIYYMCLEMGTCSCSPFGRFHQWMSSCYPIMWFSLSLKRSPIIWLKGKLLLLMEECTWSWTTASFGMIIEVVSLFGNIFICCWSIWTSVHPIDLSFNRILIGMLYVISLNSPTLIIPTNHLIHRAYILRVRTYRRKWDGVLITYHLNQIQ